MEKTMEDLEKYFLSEKVEKYVMATGTKNFYSRPKTDLEVARPLLTTMHKMHRAGVDNYVHTNGRLRKLTPRECLRLMGFCDSFKIVVSDTAMYQQAGSIETWQEFYTTVENMQDSEMQVHLTEFTDTSRVYVRANEEIFSKLFRKITVPRKINALIRQLCCNCVNGNCLLLDDGEEHNCVQLISKYGVYCNYFLYNRSVVSKRLIRPFPSLNGWMQRKS